MSSENETKQPDILSIDFRDTVLAHKGFNRNHRKENAFQRSFIALDKQGRKLVDLRIYQPGTVAYACVWINDMEHHYSSGSGKAGGYGYDKTSAAACDALENAGVKFPFNWGGSGETFRFVESLGKYLAGMDYLVTIEAHP